MAESLACTYCSTAGNCKRCTVCQEAWYCSQGCQQAHWKEHKKTCSRKQAPPLAPVAKPDNSVPQACAYCSSPGSSKRCTLCQEVWYCSQGCQQAHWKEHKKTCSRKHTPPPAPAVKPENPCIKCGKPAKKQLGGDWFCSHDCCGSKLNELTSKIKTLGQPSEAKKAQEAENKRIMDFVKGKLEPPTELPRKPIEIPPKPTDSSDSEVLDKVRGLLAKSTDSPESELLDKVRGLLEKQGKASPKTQLRKGFFTPQHSEARETKRLANFVQSVIEQEPKLPAVTNQDTKETFNQLKELMDKQREKAEQDKKLEKLKQEQERFGHWVQYAMERTREQKQNSDEDD